MSLKKGNRIRLSFGDTKTIWLYTGYTMNVNNKYLYEKQPFTFLPKPKLNDIQGRTFDYLRSKIAKKRRCDS